tara:strand:+ start:10818 stop:11120 length:303 start_codon:yes stop_codon:yes gene_type:complete
MSYATAKFTVALCDRCGFKFKLLDLKKEWTGFKVCHECYEPKHPQLEPTTNPADSEAIFDPRPDTDVEGGDGRVYTASDIVGKSFEGFEITSALGTVTIS